METISARAQFTTVVHLDKRDEYTVQIHHGERRVYEVRASIRENGMVAVTLKLRTSGKGGPPAWAVRFSELPPSIREEIQRSWSSYRAGLPENLIDQENEGVLVATNQVEVK